MEVYSVFILTTLFSCVLALRPHSMSYRTDYDYNRNADAFYKFHAEPRRNSKAVEVCTLEGAQLMKVESPEDLVQAHGMFKIYPELTPYAWVARDGLTHEPADERPLIQLSEEVDAVSSALDCDVVTRSGEMETSRCYGWQPFFCKVKAAVAPYDSRCGVYGIGYVYVESVGSCYKIPSHAYNWNEAYAECRAEGAHLLVLNSEAESHAVFTYLNNLYWSTAGRRAPLISAFFGCYLMELVPTIPTLGMRVGDRSFVVQNLTRVTVVDSSYTPWFYFAGYRAHKPEGSEPVVFKTIFNQTLQEAGFSDWSPNEPNNSHGNEYCGSFFNNNGKLNDVNCYSELGFICEKEVQK